MGPTLVLLQQRGSHDTVRELPRWLPRAVKRPALGAAERGRQMRRCRRMASAPTTISTTTFSSSWYVEPRARSQSAYATDRPMLAAAGIVVTEMNTPISAPARDSVSDTTPAMPASTATTTEKKSGLLISAETGRTPW
jgi:hypothetical protein